MKASELIPLIQQEAIAQKVDPAHAIAIFMAENSGPEGFNPNRNIDPRTTSPLGAYGVMQVRPSTLQGLIQSGYVPPDTTLQTVPGQIRAGVAAIKEAATYGDGSLKETAIRYNGSMAAWQQYKATGRLPAETAGYLQKIGMNGVGDLRPASSNSNPFGMLDNADNALGRLAQLFSGTGPARKEALGAVGAAVDATKTANNREAAALQSASEAKAGLAISAEQNLARLVDVFNIRSTNADSRLSKANAQFTQASAVDDALTPQVTEALSINPLTDLPGFLMARIQLMQQLPKLNAARSAKERSLAEIGKLQQLTSQQAQLERAGTADLLAQQARADGELAYAQAAAKNANLDREFAGAKLNDLMAGIRLEEDLLGRRLQVAQISMQAAQLRGVEAARAEEAEGINLINTGLNMFGLPSRTKTGLKALSKEAQDELARMGAAQGASTPGKFMRMALELNAIPNMMNTPGLRGQGEFLGALYSAASAAAEKPSADPAVMKMKREDRIELEADKQMKAWNDERLDGRYDRMSPGNPFRMNIGIYLQAPGNQNNPISKYVQEVRAATPGAVVDEGMLLNYALAQAKAGGDTKGISENLAEFMRAGQMHQFKSLGLPHLGASIKDPKTNALSYPASGGTSYAYGGLQKIDKAVQMLSPTDVENYIFRLLITERAAPGVGRFGPNWSTIP